MTRRSLLQSGLLSLLSAPLMSCSAPSGAGQAAVPTLDVVAATNTASPGNSPKYTYVLVHGAWAGGWEWKTVGNMLLAKGHTVYRPTMTGQGERVHLASPTINLDTHITDIVNNILFEDLTNVVLMGHSYGGMVISGVVDRIPERLKSVIYVDAFLPNDGESLNSLAGGGGGGAGRGGARGGGPPAATNGFTPLMGAGTRPNQKPPYDVPQSTATFSQAVSLKNPAGKKVPTTYILLIDDGKTAEQDTFYKYYQRAQQRGWAVTSMQSNHVVSILHPAEITKLLEACPATAKVATDF